MNRTYDEPFVQLATRIPKLLHRQLKVHVVEHNHTVMGFVIEALREKLKRHGSRARG